LKGEDKKVENRKNGNNKKNGDNRKNGNKKNVQSGIRGDSSRLKNGKKGSTLKKNDIKNDHIQIAQKVDNNYGFCHHCKQRKPVEMMLRCTYNGCKTINKPLKYYFINNTTVIKSKIDNL
jgi:hypothetical protein